MVTHSSILAWRIPRTEEPGALSSMGSQRIRHSSVQAWTHTHTHKKEASISSFQGQNLVLFSPFGIGRWKIGAGR